MKQYCLGFAFHESEDYVLLIKKTKPDWQRGKLNGIGGKIEENEGPLSAMRREFEEETGVRVDLHRWTLVTLMNFGEDSLVYVFATRLKCTEEYRTTTEEEVVMIPWRTRGDTGEAGPRFQIENLNWLLPMAELALQESSFVPHDCNWVL